MVMAPVWLLLVFLYRMATCGFEPADFTAVRGIVDRETRGGSHDLVQGAKSQGLGLEGRVKSFDEAVGANYLWISLGTKSPVSALSTPTPDNAK